MPNRKRVVDDELSLGINVAPKPVAKIAKPSRQAARAAQQPGIQRMVDDETRRALLEARLNALEADNFGEDERPVLDMEASGFYADDNDAGASAVAQTGRRKKKGIAKATTSELSRRLTNVRGTLRKVDEIAAVEAGAATDESGRLQRDRKKGGRPIFSESATVSARNDPPWDAAAPPQASSGRGAAAAAASSISASTGVEGLTGNTAKWASYAQHYVASAAPPAKKPAVPFCGVCGDRGRYSCTRCGARVCSKACITSHTETRCMK